MSGDTKVQADRRPSPELTASWFSKAHFGWVGDVFRVGQKKVLEMDDLWGLAPQDLAAGVASRFAQGWGEHKDVTAALKATFRQGFILSGWYRWWNNIVQFLPAVVLSWLLEHLEQTYNGVPAADRVWGEHGGFILAVTLAFTQLLKTYFENQYFFAITRVALNVRTALTTAVYRKALRLSPAARQGSTVGEIVNLMQLDAGRLELFSMQAHNLWAGTVQVVGFMTLLIAFISWPALVGLVFMILLMPGQGVIMMKLGAMRKKAVGFSDKRVKTENEILQGMRAIKLYNWEDSFYDATCKVRDQEISQVKAMAKLNAANSAYISATPAFVAVVSLVVYSAIGGDMRPQFVFAAIAVFSQLRFPLMMLPMTLASLADAKVSVRRLNRFLRADEINPAATLTDGVEKGGVRVEAATFHWADPDAPVARALDERDKKKKKSKKGKKDKDADAKRVSDTPTPAAAEAGAGAGAEAEAEATAARPALRNISFDAPNGSLIGIVGSVGTGKTALVSAILGELHKASGNVRMNGSVAYVAQTAWVLNATLRDNVCFGKPYEEAKYRKVLKACQLDADIRVLPAGDQTEIGERGINLSGGQKQRVSLARAMYSDAEIYIFDDPLSALDAEVGKAVFEEVICGALKDRTRLFVTNQLHFLKDTDRVLVLKSGEDGAAAIAEQDAFATLMENNGDFAALMREFGGHAEEEAEGDAVALPDLTDGATADGARARILSTTSLDPPAEAGSTDKASDSVAAARQRRKTSVQEQTAKEDHLMEQEERNKGAVKFDVYFSYLRVGGPFFAAGVLLLYSMAQVVTLGQGIWLATWTHDHKYENNAEGFYMVGYALIALLTASFSFARSYLLVWLGVRASITLHNNLLLRILRAPMSFFDTTPVGRIVSRFSKDMDAIDMLLPRTLTFCIMMMFLLVGSVAGIVFEAPWFAAALPFLAWFYYKILQYYRNVSRELKRLDSITRSPVYAHFSETLGGLGTIRAFDHADRFTKAHYATVDKNHTAFFTQRSADRWLSVRLEWLGELVVIVACTLCVISVREGNLNASEAAFAVNLSMGITMFLNWTVRTLADTEAMMNSVERVLHYTRNTEQEKAAIITPEQAAASGGAMAVTAEEWPEKGGLEFHDAIMRYREGTPVVLKGVNFKVNPREKVGIVGRTGSGKSSLMVALFRLVELEAGSINIDGVDVGKIGLSQLREKLAIIPQDAVLFSGTVRSNLDPFNKYEDADIWSAIDRVGLRQAIMLQSNAAAAEAARVARANSTGAAPKAEEKTEGKEGEEAGRKSSVTDLDSMGLDTPVAEYGENFSVGQRQLLCLARVLLRKVKILLLDEATSSVDFATDQLIQQTLRTAFSHCTILTIAHRLNTIIDSDRILVMDHGRAAEFDSPHTLLETPGSIFGSLIAELGDDVVTQLREQARAAHTGTAASATVKKEEGAAAPVDRAAERVTSDVSEVALEETPAATS